ncbi:MAG: sugar phosphate isomerase/epimerase [Chitinophagaceae bacterium]|nr:MAG: sugar phosphate isomerase/epimerase [Chitinophagaceae bacterium]
MKRLFSGIFYAMVSMAVLSACGDAGSDKTAGADSTAVSGVDSSLVSGSDWKLGVQLWTFKNFPFVTAIEKADSAGIKFIEAFPGQKLGGDFKDSAFTPDMSAESRAKVKQLLSSKGMRLVAFGVTGAKDAAGWDKLLSFAKDMGLDYINTEPNKAHWGIIDSLSGVYGVKVAIHEHGRPNPYWHPDSVLAAMKGHPNLYACADLGHWGRSGLDPVECLKKLEGRIIGSHLKDIKTFDDLKAEDVVPGQLPLYDYKKTNENIATETLKLRPNEIEEIATQILETRI